MRRRLGVPILLAALAGALLSATAIPAGAGDQASQQVAGGGVTVTATLLKGPADGTAIQLALNTHSVNLDAYDLKAVTTLRDEAGKVYPVEAVEKTGGGGHHREAVLRFAKLDPNAKAIELIVKDVAGVKERTFRWGVGE